MQVSDSYCKYAMETCNFSIFLETRSEGSLQFSDLLLALASNVNPKVLQYHPWKQKKIVRKTVHLAYLRVFPVALSMLSETVEIRVCLQLYKFRYFCFYIVYKYLYRIHVGLTRNCPPNSKNVILGLLYFHIKIIFCIV